MAARLGCPVVGQGQKRGATKGKGNGAAGAAGKKREVPLPKRIRDIRRLLKKDTLTADVRLSQVSLPNAKGRDEKVCLFFEEVMKWPFVRGYTAPLRSSGYVDVLAHTPL